MLKTFEKMGLGGIIYIVGFIGAVLVGLLEGLNVMPVWTWVPLVLVIAGLVIGFLNITAGERVPVMIAALILGAGAGVLALIPTVGGVLEAIFARIAFISLPVAIPPAVMILMEKLR